MRVTGTSNHGAPIGSECIVGHSKSSNLTGQCPILILGQGCATQDVGFQQGLSGWTSHVETSILSITAIITDETPIDLGVVEPIEPIRACQCGRLTQVEVKPIDHIRTGANINQHAFGGDFASGIETEIEIVFPTDDVGSLRLSSCKNAKKKQGKEFILHRLDQDSHYSHQYEWAGILAMPAQTYEASMKSGGFTSICNEQQ